MNFKVIVECDVPIADLVVVVVVEQPSASSFTSISRRNHYLDYLTP